MTNVLRTLIEIPLTVPHIRYDVMIPQALRQLSDIYTVFFPKHDI